MVEIKASFAAKCIFNMIHETRNLVVKPWGILLLDGLLDTIFLSPGHGCHHLGGFSDTQRWQFGKPVWLQSYSAVITASRDEWAPEGIGLGLNIKYYTIKASKANHDLKRGRKSNPDELDTH